MAPISLDFEWAEWIRGGGAVDLQLVDIGVEDAVHEADARALVGVCIGELDVDLPETAGEGGLKL